MLPGNNSKSASERIWSVAFICLCVSLLLFPFPKVEAPPQQLQANSNTPGVIQIAPGSSLRRDLAPGVAEVIGITVGQGRFLRFSIEKGDLALSTVLYGPNETKLLEHVSQEFEMVEISFPADVAGLYKIELRSRETAETPRPVELNVQPLTAVTHADRKDSEARQVLANAEVLRTSWTEASQRQAIEKYDKAALIWTSVSDSSNASLAATKAGDVWFQLSQYAEALEHFQKALKLSKRSGDRISEGRALSRMGRVYSYIGDNDLAHATLIQALTILESRASGPTSFASHVSAEAVSHMAEVIYAKGNLLKASKQFERARKMFADDRKGKARTLLFAGYIAALTGRPDNATLEISEALALYRATGDKAGEGLALTGLGLTYSRKSNEDEAIKLHREAITIFASIGNRHSEAIAYNAIGQVAENRGDHATALENYEKAFKLFERIGADFTVSSLYKLGAVHRLKKNFEQALGYLERALTLSRNARNVRLEAIVLDEIAHVYDGQGRSKEALQQYLKIQKFFETTGDLRGQAVALNNYGDVLLKLGQKQQALDLYRRILPLSEQVGDTGILLTTMHNISRAHFSLGSFEAALSAIEESIKKIEELRDNVGSPDLRALYFSEVRKHYDLKTDILMQFNRARLGQGYDVEALLINDRSRARSLIDLLSESRTHLLQGASRELIERERVLRGLIGVQAQYQMELSLRSKDSTEVAEVANEISELRAQYQEVETSLREQTPKELSLASFAPLSLEQIQNELRDSDTMLLQYSLGNDRSYLWAVTADSFHSYELPDRKTIEDAAREIYPLFTARQGLDGQLDADYLARIEASDSHLPEKASKLSQMLLGPVAQLLGTRKLLMVTEGALQSIPFEALPAPGVQLSGPGNWDAYFGSLLINTNAISSSPSISTLRAIRSQKNDRRSPNRTLVVIADPVFSRNDDRVKIPRMAPVVADAASGQSPDEGAQRGLVSISRGSGPARLTYSSLEADAISATAPRGTTMIAKGFDASRETAMSQQVGQYQIVHFATHGYLDSEHPELSGIVLSMVDPNGVRQNGLMPLHDIYSLDLSAELTVLSACQTALGKDISGEGLVGLSHSFLSAGSKSVVATLWKVDDRATANLMTGFYDSMLQKGMPTGAALRSAKLKMMKEKQWRAPYYWAGFVLQGEYTNRIAVEKNSWIRPGWVLLVLLVLVSSGVIVLHKRGRRSARAHA